MDSIVENIWHTFQNGGGVMIALLVLSVLLYWQVFGAVLFVKRVPRVAQSGEGGEIFLINRTRKEFGDLVKRQITFVMALAAAAPLLGLLGTVEGMLDTFYSLSQRGDEETSRRVSDGVSTALITTATGLMIAIPAIFAIQYIRREAGKRDQELTHQQIEARRESKEELEGAKKSKMDSGLEGDVEINLSPMIDCIFILLIFFIVTTVFVQEPGAEVERPDTAADVRLPKNSILIAITGDGRVFHGGKEVNLSRIRPIVHRILSNEKMPIIIQADRGSRHELFSRIYSECKAAGGEEVHFATLE